MTAYFGSFWCRFLQFSCDFWSQVGLFCFTCGDLCPALMPVTNPCRLAGGGITARLPCRQGLRGVWPSKGRGVVQLLAPITAQPRSGQRIRRAAPPPTGPGDRRSGGARDASKGRSGRPEPRRREGGSGRPRSEPASGDAHRPTPASRGRSPPTATASPARAERAGPARRAPGARRAPTSARRTR